MVKIKILAAHSWRGRRFLEGLDRRGDELLDPKALETAGRIVSAVRRGGDKVLLKAVRRYDQTQVKTVEELRLEPREVATEQLPTGFADALEVAIGRVERYHRRQVHAGFEMEEDGVVLEEHRRGLRRVGVYVPGGRASYPSTVLMTVIPAQLAGVEEIAVATPPGSFRSSAALRHTLARLGVKEVWGMGGAHGVAALAYGTDSVERVDKIVGPGNAWVTAAKHIVSGSVAVDSIAGPSEVLIVADKSADAEWVAADLLAQAEHDPLATALLVTPSKRLAREVRSELEIQIRRLATQEVARTALARQGAILVVRNLEHAFEITQRAAAEHVQLVGPGAEAMADRLTTSGAVFVGPGTPEVYGDYLAGPSHVLPTAGTARFTSALGVEDFVRRSHVVRVGEEASQRLARHAAAMADAEGLPAHAAAARLRRGGLR